jgi:membrane-bound ClpP family serine protease
MGQFKLRYPQVHNMADAGEILLGRIGREVFGTAQLIILIFVCGSHLLTWNIMMNTITDHGACTIVFGVCGMILSIILALPRTLQKVSWLSIVCMSPLLVCLKSG